MLTASFYFRVRYPFPRFLSTRHSLQHNGCLRSPSHSSHLSLKLSLNIVRILNPSIFIQLSPTHPHIIAGHARGPLFRHHLLSAIPTRMDSRHTGANPFSIFVVPPKLSIIPIKPVSSLLALEVRNSSDLEAGAIHLQPPQALNYVRIPISLQYLTMYMSCTLRIFHGLYLILILELPHTVRRRTFGPLRILSFSPVPAK